MRRLLAFVLVAVFSLQATASAASPGQVQGPNMQPLLSAIENSQVFALITGQADRYAAMHAPAPTFPRLKDNYERPNLSSNRFAHRSDRYGSPGRPPEMLRAVLLPGHAPVDPLATSGHNGAPVRASAINATVAPAQNAVSSRPVVVAATTRASVNRVAVSRQPTPTPPPTYNVTVSVGGTADTATFGSGVIEQTESSVSQGTCGGIATLAFVSTGSGQSASWAISATGIAIGTCSGSFTFENTTLGISSGNVGVTVIAPTATPVPTPTPIPVTPTPVPTATPVGALAPASTGINPWWTYETKALAGVGKAMVNVANGNLLVQADDIEVPERGVDLVFGRTYNSQSAHDTAGSDGAAPSVYGNGWTNTFDAHLSYNSAANVMSVYDIDGARYDYTANGSGGWTPGAGMQGTTLVFDGSGGYYWTKKNGTIYYFFTPLQPAQYAGYAGRTYQIIGRNHYNYINFVYSWTGGNSTTVNNLTTITAEHSDGQSITETFAMFGTNLELASLTRPDNLTITYNYDTSGDLLEVTRPGKATDDATQTASITSLTEEYWYWPGTHEMRWVGGPRFVSSSYNDGSNYGFTYDANTTSGRLTWISDYGLMDFTPNDGTSTQLQSGASMTGNSLWRQTEFQYNYNASGFNVISDTQGHETQWQPDSVGRVTETSVFAGPGDWLVTYATWDANNDLTASVDPRGSETNYAYDANGNAIAVGEPSVTTSAGTFRPTKLYSYDSFNNVVAKCDEVKTNALGLNWTSTLAASDTLCPTGTGATGATQYVWDYADGAEPLGLLVSSYTPLGYETTYAYTGGAVSDNYGLPSTVVGASFAQSNGTNAQPQQVFTYDAYGNLQAFSKGYGSYQATHDVMNRTTSITDPDGVTSRTYFNPDGTVECKQSAYQYSLDGTACGVNSEGFVYDADGNELSETHHYGQTPTNGVVTGTTQKWYDGEDRLIEVEQPADANTDNNIPWRTRYIYDITEDQQVTITQPSGSSASYYAYGNLYKTQNYFTTSWGNPSPTYEWYDVNGNAFDSHDRSVARYEHQPFGPLDVSTSAYDASPYEGLLASKTDAVGVTTSYTYDALNRVAQLTFSDGTTPSRTYTYDPDGRTASVLSSTYGADSYQYDADGNELQYTEGGGGGATSPATITYAYYPSGWRSSLSISSSDLTQANEFSYSYRNDARRSTLAVAGYATPFAWTYTNAGRELTKSDPLTGTSAPAVANWSNAVTFVPRSASYDAYGRLSSLTLPNTGAYTSLSHDTEGDITGSTIALPTQQLPAPPVAQYNGQSAYPLSTSDTYDVRGELAQENGYAPNGLPMTTSQGGHCFGHAYGPGMCLSGSIDPFTGAARNGATGTIGVNNLTKVCQLLQPKTFAGTWQFDADGRQSEQGPVANSYPTCYVVSSAPIEQRTYDAENHVVSDACGYGTGGVYNGCTSLVTCVGTVGCNGGTTTTGPTAIMGYGANGHVRTANLGGYNYTLHWDGDELLFVTDSTGALDQINIEKLGALVLQPAGDQHLAIIDRDFGGQEVGIHTSASTWTSREAGVSWVWAILPNRLGPNDYTNFVDNFDACLPGCYGSAYLPALTGSGLDQSVLFDSGRTDGYYMAGNIIQSDRAYDPNTQQWSSPDRYKGDVNDPVSQRSYAWNKNNPVANSDPSGFDPDAYEAALGEISDVVAGYIAGGATAFAVTGLFSAIGLAEVAPIFAVGLGMTVAELAKGLTKTGVDALYEHNAGFRRVIHRIPLGLLQKGAALARVIGFWLDKKDEAKDVLDLYRWIHSVGYWTGAGGTTADGTDVPTLWTFHWSTPGAGNSQGLGPEADGILGVTGGNGGTGTQDDPFEQMQLHPML